MAIDRINWDNLRLFLAVVRAQSAQEAARRMEVDHSTITRRLHRLEKELGAQLFERTPAGHLLTPAGQRLLEHVERMESSMVLVGEDIGGDSHMLTGHVRLGATEGFGSFFLAPHLSYFCDRHPGIQVELLIVPRFINLSQREADQRSTSSALKGAVRCAASSPTTACGCMPAGATCRASRRSGGYGTLLRTGSSATWRNWCSARNCAT